VLLFLADIISEAYHFYAHRFTRVDSIASLFVLELAQILFDNLMLFIIPISTTWFNLIKRFNLIDEGTTLLSYRREVVSEPVIQFCSY
jgi:hypothetical protein